VSIYFFANKYLLILLNARSSKAGTKHDVFLLSDRKHAPDLRLPVKLMQRSAPYRAYLQMYSSCWKLRVTLSYRGRRSTLQFLQSPVICRNQFEVIPTNCVWYVCVCLSASACQSLLRLVGGVERFFSILLFTSGVFFCRMGFASQKFDIHSCCDLRLRADSMLRVQTTSSVVLIPANKLGAYYS